MGLKSPSVVILLLFCFLPCDHSTTTEDYALNWNKILKVIQAVLEELLRDPDDFKTFLTKDLPEILRLFTTSDFLPPNLVRKVLPIASSPLKVLTSGEIDLCNYTKGLDSKTDNEVMNASRVFFRQLHQQYITFIGARKDDKAFWDNMHDKFWSIIPIVKAGLRGEATDALLRFALGKFSDGEITILTNTVAAVIPPVFKYVVVPWVNNTKSIETIQSITKTILSGIEGIIGKNGLINIIKGIVDLDFPRLAKCLVSAVEMIPELVSKESSRPAVIRGVRMVVPFLAPVINKPTNFVENFANASEIAMRMTDHETQAIVLILDWAFDDDLVTIIVRQINETHMLDVLRRLTAAIPSIIGPMLDQSFKHVPKFSETWEKILDDKLSANLINSLYQVEEVQLLLQQYSEYLAALKGSLIDTIDSAFNGLVQVTSGNQLREMLKTLLPLVKLFFKPESLNTTGVIATTRKYGEYASGALSFITKGEINFGSVFCNISELGDNEVFYIVRDVSTALLLGSESTPNSLLNWISRSSKDAALWEKIRGYIVSAGKIYLTMRKKDITQIPVPAAKLLTYDVVPLLKTALKAAPYVLIPALSKNIPDIFNGASEVIAGFTTVDLSRLMHVSVGAYRVLNCMVSKYIENTVWKLLQPSNSTMNITGIVRQYRGAVVEILKSMTFLDLKSVDGIPIEKLKEEIGKMNETRLNNYIVNAVLEIVEALADKLPFLADDEAFLRNAQVISSSLLKLVSSALDKELASGVESVVKKLTNSQIIDLIEYVSSIIPSLVNPILRPQVKNDKVFSIIRQAVIILARVAETVLYPKTDSKPTDVQDYFLKLVLKFFAAVEKDGVIGAISKILIDLDVFEMVQEILKSVAPELVKVAPNARVQVMLYNMTQLVTAVDVGKLRNATGPAPNPWLAISPKDVVKVFTRAFIENRKLRNFIEDGIIKIAIDGGWKTDAFILFMIQEILGSYDPETVSTKCVRDLKTFQNGLVAKRRWALEMIDSFGKPGGGILEGNVRFFGNVEQCQKIEVHDITAGLQKSFFNGQWCALEIKYSLIPIPEMNPYLGICMPDSCTALDSKTVFQSGLIGELLPIGTVSCPAEVSFWKDIWNNSFATGVFIFAVFLGSLILLSSIIDGLLLSSRTETKKKPAAEGPIYENLDFKKGVVNNAYVSDSSVTFRANGDVPSSSRNHIPPENNLSQRKRQALSIPLRILQAFSLYTNAGKLLSFEKPAEQLGSLHGIRFFSMSWVVLGHSFVLGFAQMPVSDNYLGSFAEMIKRFSFQPIVNGTVCVDSFFVLSGLLVTYLFLKEAKKRNGISILQIILMYIHRYWRLTVSYGLTILFVAAWLDFWGQGPFWEGFVKPASENCRKYWWANIFYVNNFVDMKKMCIGWSWYLSNDMQFFLVSPLFLVALFYKPIIGLIMCSLMVVLSVLSTGFIMNAEVTPEEYEQTKIGILSSSSVVAFNEVYVKPYCRCGAYFVGMIAGYILYVKKRKIRMNKILACFLWLFFAALAIAVLYIRYTESRLGIPGLEAMKTGMEPTGYWPRWWLITYEALHRPLWAVCIAWVALACCTGNGGVIDSILSWAGWIPFSRVTYMAYLWHEIVLWVYYFNLTSMVHITDRLAVLHFLGILLLSMMVAIATTLVLESPFMALDKIVCGLITGKSSQKPKETTIKSNGGASAYVQEDDDQTTLSMTPTYEEPNFTAPIVSDATKDETKPELEQVTDF